MLDKTVKNDVEKGCIGANLANVIEPHWSSEIERIVLGILEDDNPFTSGSAAVLLGKHGSVDVRDKIWKRFERFRQEESDKKDSTENKINFSGWQVFSAESSFVAALSESPEWLFDQEPNRRASKLCLYEFCQERTEKLDEIFSAPNQIETSFDEENQISFSVNQYKNLSLDALKKNSSNFPSIRHLLGFQTAKIQTTRKIFKQ